MIQLPNGCYCSNLTVHPANWKQTSASVKSDWWIHYRFYDPNEKERYPKGKQCIVKGGLNKFKTVAERRAGVKVILEELLHMLQVEGYNPITNIIAQTNGLDINEQTTWYDAITYVAGKLKTANSTVGDIKSMLKYLKEAGDKIRIQHLTISQLSRKQVKLLLEAAGGSNHRYNKYRSYLMMIFKELLELEVVENNPIRELSKKATNEVLRNVLSPEERMRIQLHLKNAQPDFFRFIEIFFHSGARVVEMLAIRKKDVDLSAQTFVVTVNKGRKSRQMMRPIKNIVLPQWKALCEHAADDDYIFSVGLKPGHKMIRFEQITRRWKVHVKDKLGITADFYSLKHLNLDETSSLLNSKDASAMAGHTTPVVTIKHYLVNEKQREMERLRNVDNPFAG